MMSRSQQIAPSGISASQVESVPHQPGNPLDVQASGTLRLRAENEPSIGSVTEERDSHRRIHWSEDVIDNEGMGKKSSKVCCIYHKSRPVGESSSESESSDSNSSDPNSESEPDDSRNSMGPPQVHVHESNHPHEHISNHGSETGRSTSRCPNHNNKKLKRRKPSPNAYEKMPKTIKGR
ncbi:type 1 phosphatases regulator ypi1 [Aspergillus coremiiformis]|uniref:Type 1 phosphatases regulator n=1 Tax=Aspergillus coremiiformis TaxID=138285 RepID=A0A5N6YSA7_9EURO|nr:type 1 phosphatases regulator ypi1 [Aspergillus coremiiformis]